MKWLSASVAACQVFLSVQAAEIVVDVDDATIIPDEAANNDTGQFAHFVAHDSSMTCTSDEHATPFNTQIRGVNLGGWMVLEPWITPTLFYQFLGGNETTTAMDMYSFCDILGEKEESGRTTANEQLRRHWDLWVTEDIIKSLADSETINSIRLPVGDFMYETYGPFSDCVEGALEKVDELLDWAEKYNITVLLDVHTMKGSQNGFDNGGTAKGLEWTSINSDISGFTTFSHWPIRSAEWIGKYDPESDQDEVYSTIYHDNIQHALNVITAISKRYHGHKAVLGIEPLNEPWQLTPIDELKRFYWEGYLIAKQYNPDWLYVMHDSFRFDPAVWGGFMDGCPERVLDTHIYQAWRDPDSRIGFYADACSQKSNIAAMERAFGPVVVGEWSLATDNCAMWLNGFNDNLPGFPRLPCKYTPCAETYLEGQSGTPVDPSKPIQGPYGTGMSGPIFGQCPGSRDWLKESSGNPQTGMDWIRAPPQAPKRLDDTDNVMRHLALKKIDAFAGIGHGYYFWNFRTDLYEPQWSYMEAMERKWIPQAEDFRSNAVAKACLREDRGDFRCVLKHGQIDRTIRGALAYIFDMEKVGESDEAKRILSLSGKELEEEAQVIVSEYFRKYRAKGATCDFGGIAMLVEEERQLVDDDAVGLDDDEYFHVVSLGPPLWLLISCGIFIAVIGACFGFVIAMRVNPSFNRKVRESQAFLPMTNSRSKLVRSSLALPDLQYDDVQDLSNDEIQSLLRK